MSSPSGVGLHPPLLRPELPLLVRINVASSLAQHNLARQREIN